MTSLSFPVGMKSIGNYAFAGCTRLEEVHIQDGVSFIGRAAFTNCPELRTATIPENTIVIGPAAFRGCKNIVIFAPEGSFAERYAENEHLAFQDTGSLYDPDCITELVDDFARIKYVWPGGDIVFPEGKTYISAGLFRGCSSLTGITIPEGVEIHPDNPDFRFENGLILSKDGTTLYAGAGGIEGHVCVPEGVKKIADSALYGCKKIIGITLPDTITATGTKAFAQCTALTTLKLSDKTKKISAQLCEGCKNLREVQLPSKLTGIGKYTFAGTGLERIAFPESLKTIDNHAFDGAFLTLLTLPVGLEELGASAFANCSLRCVTFMGSQVKFGQKPFGEGDLPEIIVNGGSIAKLPAAVQGAAAASFAKRYLCGRGTLR